MTASPAHAPSILGAPNPVTVYDPNNYVPVFMPEQSIYFVAAGGIQDWVASVPYCLSFDSVDELVKAIQNLGYPNTASFPATPPVPAGNTFAGGPYGDGTVPWLGISPVPPTPGNPPIWHASDGAFVIVAGKYADFWNHGVKPFIGSSYHLGLIEDIKMRMDAARNGQPNLGLAMFHPQAQSSVTEQAYGKGVIVRGL